jgi:four helix bundle protein
LGLVLEEADETVYWLELLTESGIVPASRINELQKEANELTAIFASARNTVRRKQNGGPV